MATGRLLCSAAIGPPARRARTRELVHDRLALREIANHFERTWVNAIAQLKRHLPTAEQKKLLDVEMRLSTWGPDVYEIFQKNRFFEKNLAQTRPAA